ncbi:Cytochrome P450 [Macrophomina phaseolina MS6]|uniref:Cytochrome P450 n=1 Tax=Macrophomina phaseolina (strain MS6) TaxID=1126212 RepID=K2S2N1_MACPH|nr:Cytochrome P450 [Macrophomina phaseolina MS6]
MAVLATLLHPLTTPVTRARLRREINEGAKAGRVHSPVTNAEVNGMSFLQLVIRDGLRLHPPFMGLLAKDVPPQGEVIKEKYVPGVRRSGIIFCWRRISRKCLRRMRIRSGPRRGRRRRMRGSCGGWTRRWGYASGVEGGDV